MEKILLSKLVDNQPVSSIGILMPYDDIGDQKSCEKGLINVLALIRAEYPKLKIAILPYFPSNPDRDSVYDNAHSSTESSQLTLTIISAKEVWVYSYTPDTKLNGSLLNLDITKNKLKCFH